MRSQGCVHTPVETVWEPRTYPGRLSLLKQVRADLALDLNGFDGDLAETVVLCASELFANCAKFTDSGAPGGEVLRFLAWEHPDRIRVGFTDGGGSGAVPEIPTDRDEDEWDWAEGQRGLAMVENLSTGWGYLRTAPWADLGTHVWAAFPVPPGSPTPNPRPTYRFTTLYTG